MPTRSYSGNAKPTTLTGAISAAATSITVADGTGYPDGSLGPFVITIDAGLTSEEKVLVATRTGSTFSVSARGFDGTTASDHSNAAQVQHTYSATDAREANAHVNDTTGDPHPQYTTAAELSSALAGYLTTTGKAADSNLLDGIDSTGFATSGHTHAFTKSVSGQYTGDGTNDRRIASGQSFSLKAVIITSSAGVGINVNHTAGVLAQLGLGFDSAGAIYLTSGAHNRRPGIDLSDFLVSTGHLNNSTVVYSWVAFT